VLVLKGAGAGLAPYQSGRVSRLSPDGARSGYYLFVINCLWNLWNFRKNALTSGVARLFSQNIFSPMKKILTLVASAGIAFSCANAAIIFNPANPLNVVNQAGFTGTFNPDTPFSKALVRFNFSGLTIPLPASFQITNISLSGPGITSSISFSDLTIVGNGVELTSFVNLNNNVDPLDFAGSALSFSLPGGAVNLGSSFTVAIRYSDAFGDQANTSSGVTFSAQNIGPEPIPEPGTWAAAALLVGGAAYARWRKRKVA
jgi:hypothetical protein